MFAISSSRSAFNWNVGIVGWALRIMLDILAWRMYHDEFVLNTYVESWRCILLVNSGNVCTLLSEWIQIHTSKHIKSLACRTHLMKLLTYRVRGIDTEWPMDPFWPSLPCTDCALRPGSPYANCSWVECQKTCLKETLLLSYQKKDWRLRYCQSFFCYPAEQSFFRYDSDFTI